MEMPIPTDWNGSDCCRWVVYWPESEQWKAILYGLLEQPSRGRFWDANTGNIVDTQEAFRPFYNLNFELEEVLMSCNDSNIATAIEAIAQAIVTASANANASANASANACCEQTIINQGGGYVGGTTDPTTGDPVPIYGTQPPKSIPSGEFPDGYEDLEEYQLDKCQMANLVISGVIASLNGLGALGVFNATALAALIVVAITGVIVFPPALIPVAAAAIGMMSVEVTLCALLSEEIASRRSQFVCVLYNADAVEPALAAVSELLDICIAALSTSSLFGIALKTLALSLFNADTLNQLFTKTAHLVFPDADCSGCDVIEIMLGTLTSGVLNGNEGTQFTMSSGTSVDIDSVTRYYCQFRCPEGDCREFTATTTGWSDPCPNQASLDTFQSLNYAGTVVLDNVECADPSVTDYAGQYLNFRSATPFTLAVTVGPSAECPS